MWLGCAKKGSRYFSGFFLNYREFNTDHRKCQVLGLLSAVSFDRMHYQEPPDDM
jgi:hypothetical protein